MSMMNVQERQMLVESARRWLGDLAPGRPAAALWADHAEMGWLALALPEALGGLGGPAPELCLLAEEMGRALAADLYLPSAVAVGAWLRAFEPPCAEAVADALATGRLRLATTGHRLGQAPDDTPPWRLEPDGDGWRLRGPAPVLLPGAQDVDALLALATLDNGDWALLWLNADLLAPVSQAQVLMDGGGAARVALDGLCVPADALRLRQPRAWFEPRWREARRVHALAACAQAVGAMARAQDITLAYTLERQQFGRAIATHQVVQHRLVDLMVEIEEVRALVMAAASAQGEAAEALACAALAHGAATARHVWEEAIQLHGAIGMTEEYHLGAYVRRLALFARAHGDEAEQLERVAQASLAQLDNKEEAHA
jgi:butyryl-CoA dehydrogenase